MSDGPWVGVMSRRSDARFARSGNRLGASHCVAGLRSASDNSRQSASDTASRSRIPSEMTTVGSRLGMSGTVDPSESGRGTSCEVSPQHGVHPDRESAHSPPGCLDGTRSRQVRARKRRPQRSMPMSMLRRPRRLTLTRRAQHDL